jgi:hypothetical protein
MLPEICVIRAPGAPEGMEDKMRAMEIHDYARKLFERRGASAIAEAAQKAADLEKEGQTEDATNWRHISDAMRQMRGPHQS